jgi:hypothetical protein
MLEANHPPLPLDLPQIADEAETSRDALDDQPMRFRVEVSVSTVDRLIRLGLLGSGQREDLIAILAATKRLARQLDFCRVP